LFLTALPWPAEGERLAPRVVETAEQAADETLGEDVFAKEVSLWASQMIARRTRGSAPHIGEILQGRARSGDEARQVGQPVWVQVSGLGRGGVAPRGLRGRDL
jgi:hypothetical protein